mgnify:CR=1 FL=1
MPLYDSLNQALWLVLLLSAPPIIAASVVGPLVAVLVPTGINGPAFLVFKNYDAIYSYNAADSYALAISLPGPAQRRVLAELPHLPRQLASPQTPHVVCPLRPAPTPLHRLWLLWP